MTEKALSRDAVTSLSGSAATAVAWRACGQLHVTVIAKATFAFAHDAVMPRVDPQEILTAEVNYNKNPARSARFTTDLAPYLGRADVLFTGNAHALPGSTVIALTARLAILDGNTPLLDKRILVQDPVGFQKMPLVYERAYGGIDCPENPLGIGAGAGNDEPNLVDPANPERTVCFGPIGRAWPARRWLLGSTPRKALEGPIAEIPDGFDWAYFHSAPADQRIEYPHGDEWLVLEGLHAGEPRLRTRLPGARGRARIHGLSAFGVSEGEPLELIADTLRIDGEQQRCTVVFRRSFPVASDAALASVRVLAGVELPGETLAWPAQGGAEGAPAEPPLASRLRSSVRAPTPGTVYSPPALERVAGPEPTSVLGDEDLEFVGDDAKAPAKSRSAAPGAPDDPGDTLPPDASAEGPPLALPFQPAADAGARRDRARPHGARRRRRR